MKNTDTIESIFKDIEKRVNLMTPYEITTYACKLSVLLSNHNEKMARLEKEYWDYWATVRENQKSHSDAESFSKGSEEYRLYREAYKKFDVINVGLNC